MRRVAVGRNRAVGRLKSIIGVYCCYDVVNYGISARNKGGQRGVWALLILLLSSSIYYILIRT